MLSGDSNKYSLKKSVGLISQKKKKRKKKKPLCTCSTLFMYISLPSVHFFFSLTFIFTLVAASISHILTAAINFSCFSSNKTGLFCFLSLSL